MDVRKILALFSAVSFIVACGGKGSGPSSVNKASDEVCANSAIPNEKLVRWKDGKITRLRVGGLRALAQYMEKNNSQIDYVEDNFKIVLPQMDSLAPAGWGGTPNWGIDTVRAQELWNKNIKGDGVLVAIVDSGIDRTHSQLKSQLYVNPKEILNGIDDDGNGLIDDINGYDFTSSSGNLQDTTGHGTHIAGIIAASHSRGEVKGMAPGARIVAYDFFGDQGDGSVFTAILGIRKAVEAGAKVINASWGGAGCSRSLKDVLDSLSAHNVLFVAASGNDGKNIDIEPSYPASFKALAQITVGAMTVDEYTARFSNYGSNVHLVAPGANIFSTYPVSSYTYLDGTSMAAPFVSGAAALLWSAFPQASALDIKNALVTSVHAGPYPVLSRGALDVAAAYEVLARQYDPR